LGLESLFSLAGLVAAAGWLILVFLPRWRHTQIICAVVIPLAIALLYLGLIARYLGRGPGGFGSLAEVGLLFSQPGALLAGWVHYLAFDLFIGSWEVRDSQKQGVSHWFVIPCLIATFMLGPIGLLTYFIIRSIKLRTVSAP
jgi:hypothetical protein